MAEKNGRTWEVFMFALGLSVAITMTVVGASHVDLKADHEKTKDKVQNLEKSDVGTERDVKAILTAIEQMQTEREYERRMLRAVARKLRVEVEEEKR
jgi:hypothetical protein